MIIGFILLGLVIWFITYLYRSGGYRHDERVLVREVTRYLKEVS